MIRSTATVIRVSSLGGAGPPAHRRMAEWGATEQFRVRVLDTATLFRMWMNEWMWRQPSLQYRRGWGKPRKSFVRLRCLYTEIRSTYLLRRHIRLGAALCNNSCRTAPSVNQRRQKCSGFSVLQLLGLVPAPCESGDI